MGSRTGRPAGPALHGFAPVPSASSAHPPHRSGASLSPRLGASETNAVFLPGHLHEHTGGKLAC